MSSLNIILLNEEEEKYMVSPNMRIQDVLNSVCQKHGMDPSRHVLSHNNYFLCNEIQLNVLNFPENETLVLLEDLRPTSHESVKIVLRIKDSTMSSFFNPDVTLWKVVKSLVASKALQIPLSTPILIHGETEYIGFSELSKVTPRSLGVCKGILKFRFLLVEDHVLAKRNTKVLGSIESMQFELTKKYDTNSPFTYSLISSESVFVNLTMEDDLFLAPGIESRGSSIFDEVLYLGNRNALAFRLPDRLIFSPGESDDFYDLAAEDVNVMYKQLYSKRKDLEEQLVKLPGSNEPIIQKENQLTVIRIEFPDRTVLQGVFNVSEKIKDVEEFVKCYKRLPNEFVLIVGPPRVILDSEKTLDDCSLVPNGKVYYKAIEKQPDNTAYLKEDVLRHLTTLEGACYAAALCRTTFPGFEISPEEKADSPVSSDSGSERGDKDSFSSIESFDKRGFTLRPFKSRISKFF